MVSGVRSQGSSPGKPENLAAFALSAVKTRMCNKLWRAAIMAL